MDNSNKNGDVAPDADLAQAYKELLRGEKTAQMLESNLTNLEKKIDDILERFEAQESEAQTKAKDGASGDKEETNENGHKES
ncbi:hypothetical protein SBOR_0404 [Sclerotinia borealis F-4128]|uniref:Uncharacterized protein n=1 Tax=Sclerotinia borealis (strain F-4128) TaxID=1432307 RepID=W9CQT8_SCLBF|nr:hypothetical protein SBOR_0404 [Sclerotinia borealis F-4128]